jgi:hypothetical protein
MDFSCGRDSPDAPESTNQLGQELWLSRTSGSSLMSSSS